MLLLTKLELERSQQVLPLQPDWAWQHNTKMKKLDSIFNTCILASTVILSTPAVADGLEPLTDILNTPGSAGLGIAVRANTSPYLGGGTRYDLMPLYL